MEVQSGMTTEAQFWIADYSNCIHIIYIDGRWDKLPRLL